jgi:phage gpG-like protein
MNLLCVVPIAIVAAAQPADLDAVLERLDDYLERYESELSAVVADEELIQETDGRLTRRQSRRLHSEIAFLRLPGGLEWMGFRRVHRVDGKPLTDAKSLTELLATTSSDALQQAGIIVNESAKYNLGNPRTTNMPNLPLELLSRKYRHRYEVSHKGRPRMRGHATDNRNPTWLRVDFALNQALQMLVPVTLRERFNWIADTGTSLATYTNFRRFQTSARIVPQ